MRRALLVCLVAALTGCFSQRGPWRPTVDPRMSAHPGNEERDQTECRNSAQAGAGSLSQEAGKGAVKGAVGGAALGAAIGSFRGNAGKGAKMGALLGAVGGSSSGSARWFENFKYGYIRCMDARGYRVID